MHDYPKYRKFCSLTFAILKNRVVGGQLAGVTEWPWQTLLADISSSGGGYQYCGATLISPDWVITAAHCTYNRIAANIGVVVGQYNSVANLSSTAQVDLRSFFNCLRNIAE